MNYSALEDEKIVLAPLTKSHIQAMRKWSTDKDLWRWYTADLTDPDDLEKWMMARLHEVTEGEKMSYALILKETQEVIGSTSFGQINLQEKYIEIGWTWLAKPYLGSGINKHMKFLMLAHAFDELGMERVELRTDEQNVRSRRAMVKIGATHEGTLRSQRTTQGGKRRNTVIYSIIQSEWPTVRSTHFKDL